MRQKSKLIHITFAVELLNTLDHYAQQEYLTRCEFVRQAVVEKLRTLKPSPPASQPVQPAVDLLMTDRQLDDLRLALTLEWRRRHHARQPPTAYQ